MATLIDSAGCARRAVICGINSLCTGCRLTGDPATIEQLITDIDSLSPEDAVEEHVAEARETALGQLH